MRINFKGDLSGLEYGIRILSSEIGLETGSGLTVKVENRPGNIEVAVEKDSGVIRYDSKIHFFRALGLLAEGLKEKDSFEIVETPQFSTNGIMIDVSRNAVMKVCSIKELIRRMALMGLNMIMLYTEDTYTVDERPYFGYMRGRYSYEELKECDNYADIFGIEIIPCIQTLAHLSIALRWDFEKDIKDTGDILLAGSDETYKFIEEMIKAASAPFRSRRIHIGMDEANDIGLGKYLEINGYQRRIEIMNRHLSRVAEITEKYSLKPMIWSDMYFRLASESGSYYDPDVQIPKDIIGSLPKDVQMVYWHYDGHDEELYAGMIRKHKEFGSIPVFAGGIYTWCGMNIQYNMTFSATNAALGACKKEEVSDVIATMWGDNGAETNYFSGLLGMQLYAEHGYARELDMGKLKKRFKFCTGANADDFMDISKMDVLPGTEDEKPETPANPSKYLLWQDILLGMFDSHVEGYDLARYYQGLEDIYKKHIEQNPRWGFIFEVPQKLSAVLSMKCDMGIRLKNSYDKGDMDLLRSIAEKELPELARRVEELKAVHREQWFKTYKPFGWDILDIRYGGVLSRIDTAIKRLKEYISGKIGGIEELEEERLEFRGVRYYKHSKFGSCNLYTRIASPSYF